MVIIKENVKILSYNQKNKENEFKGSKDHIINIARANILVLITNTEDKQFLIVQRGKGRWSSRVSVEKILNFYRKT